MQFLEPRTEVNPVRFGSTTTPEEERRLRRMLSNRASARRSRLRKQRQFEDLRNLQSRLKSENIVLSNRLGAVLHFTLLLRRENDRLRSESATMHTRLAVIIRFRQLQKLTSQIIRFRQLQKLTSQAAASACGGTFSPSCGGDPNLSSLIV